MGNEIQIGKEIKMEAVSQVVFSTLFVATGLLFGYVLAGGSRTEMILEPLWDAMIYSLELLGGLSLNHPWDEVDG